MMWKSCSHHTAIERARALVVLIFCPVQQQHLIRVLQLPAKRYDECHQDHDSTHPDTYQDGCIRCMPPQDIQSAPAVAVIGSGPQLVQYTTWFLPSNMSSSTRMCSGARLTRYEMKSSYLRTGTPFKRRWGKSLGKTQQGTVAKGLRVRMANCTRCSVACRTNTQDERPQQTAD